jgi:superoxide dismutase, Cu-Zn family
MKYTFIAMIGFLSLFSLSASGESVKVEVFDTKNPKQSLGFVHFEDTKYGLLIRPTLQNLPAGAHGFHIHAMNNCQEHGMAAGGHYDPKKTNTHQGPFEDGHLGDLPVLVVNTTGVANISTLAPRLTVKDINGRALMIHKGGDNYSDTPPLGGGGERIGCGVFGD